MLTEDGASYARRTTRYKVRRGDTVQTVADNFSTPPTMVRRWNHLRGDSLRGRRVVYVHLPVTPNALAESPLPHLNQRLERVNPGINQIVSASQGATRRDSDIDCHDPPHDRASLERDNGGLAMLRPGMVLVIRGVR